MKKLLKNILNWFLAKPKSEPVAPVVKHEVRKVTYTGPKFTKALEEASAKPKRKPAVKKTTPKQK